MGNLASVRVSNFWDNFIIMLTVDILGHPDLDFKTCVNNLMLVSGHVSCICCMAAPLTWRLAALTPNIDSILTTQ